MRKIARFEKIGREQWRKDADIWRSLGYTDDEIDRMYDQIKLPSRATAGSAGYDFISPGNFLLDRNETVVIPTGIRILIDPGWFLGVFPRSSIGFKYGVCFANTIPVVDSDYYGAKNEGHILLKFVNRSTEGKRFVVHTGDRFAQGIFLPYGVTTDDNATAERTGGIGSTGESS